MFLSLDGTFWIQVINFFVFYAILNVVYIKPAAEALRKRRAYLDSVHAEYEASRHEVRELQGRAEERRGDARREGEQRAATVRSESQRQSDAIAIEAQGRATAIIEEAQRKVEAEVKTARAGEDALVKDLAETMLSRAMGSA